MQQNLSNHIFKAIIQKYDQTIIEERCYEDISYVNYWTDKDGNVKYRSYMKNGEALFLADNVKFQRVVCAGGVLGV